MPNRALNCAKSRAALVKVLGHMNIRTTEIYLHDLGVDREAAGIFEDITHGITHEGD
mgnify:CR=1 FL=1